MDNNRKMFGNQKKEPIGKAKWEARGTFSALEINCNNMLVGNDYWKSLAFP